ncbi:hypothetical protein TRIP_B30014 [uncultured Desulfatiglans sp.]|nr:hypothetical protein TRIP_B30014 [uncultured Desulfatiglans sp.]
MFTGVSRIQDKLKFSFKQKIFLFKVRKIKNLHIIYVH